MIISSQNAFESAQGQFSVAITHRGKHASDRLFTVSIKEPSGKTAYMGDLSYEDLGQIARLLDAIR